MNFYVILGSCDNFSKNSEVIKYAIIKLLPLHPYLCWDNGHHYIFILKKKGHNLLFYLKLTEVSQNKVFAIMDFCLAKLNFLLYLATFLIDLLVVVIFIGSFQMLLLILLIDVVERHQKGTFPI